jgi:hypothetical protein
MILFRTGSGDAEELAHHFEGIPPHFFAELATGNIVAKTLARGEPTVATGKTMPAAFPCYGRGERLIAHSHNRHTRPRDVVEAKLLRWLRQHDERKRTGGYPQRRQNKR